MANVGHLPYASHSSRDFDQPFQSQLPYEVGTGLPWWSTCQCRGHVFNPWSKNIPHASGQLSPVPAAEVQAAEPVSRNT